jgi:hypothetical protein
MKDLNSIDEHLFKEIVSKGKLEMPILDFEDSVMRQIAAKKISKSSFTKDIKLSWIFFVIFSFLGVAISYFLSHTDQALFGLKIEMVTLIFQMCFALLLFGQLDNLLLIAKKRKSRNFFG